MEAKRLSFKKGVANFIENCQNRSRKIITEIISSNMEVTGILTRATSVGWQ